MTEAPCPRVGRWIGGCRFEARYDRVVPPPLAAMLARATRMGTLGEASDMTVPVYVRDVCVRCGRTIERERAA